MPSSPRLLGVVMSNAVELATHTSPNEMALAMRATRRIFPLLIGAVLATQKLRTAATTTKRAMEKPDPMRLPNQYKMASFPARKAARPIVRLFCPVMADEATLVDQLRMVVSSGGIVGS